MTRQDRTRKDKRKNKDDEKELHEITFGSLPPVVVRQGEGGPEYRWEIPTGTSSLVNQLVEALRRLRNHIGEGTSMLDILWRVLSFRRRTTSNHFVVGTSRLDDLRRALSFLDRTRSNSSGEGTSRLHNHFGEGTSRLDDHRRALLLHDPTTSNAFGEGTSRMHNHFGEGTSSPVNQFGEGTSRLDDRQSALLFRDPTTSNPFGEGTSRMHNHGSRGKVIGFCNGDCDLERGCRCSPGHTPVAGGDFSYHLCPYHHDSEDEWQRFTRIVDPWYLLGMIVQMICSVVTYDSSKASSPARDVLDYAIVADAVLGFLFAFAGKWIGCHKMGGIALVALVMGFLMTMASVIVNKIG